MPTVGWHRKLVLATRGVAKFPGALQRPQGQKKWPPVLDQKAALLMETNTSSQVPEPLEFDTDDGIDTDDDLVRLPEGLLLRQRNV